MLYKNGGYFQQHMSTEFDTIHKPGTVVSNSGVYRCEGCGDEIAANKGNPLPPQNHHQHSTSQGTIRWRMIGCAVQR